ncbi:MAG: metalloregulator ArsR/SmtB family transcription factor [Alphaproteobacteria bacterium]
MLKKQPLNYARTLSPKADKVVRLMRMLSHPQRLCIVCHLSDKPRRVTELVELCGIAQAQVSQFLTRMKLEGFVAVESVGRERIYRLVDEHALATMKALHSIHCMPEQSQHYQKRKLSS